MIARPKLDADTLADLYRRDDRRSLLACVSVAGAIAAVLTAYELERSALTFAVCFLLIGALQHHLSIIQHEANHFLLFADRRCNEWVGALAGFAVGFTMTYRRTHLKHHQTLGDEIDPDLANYRDYPLSPGRFLVDVAKNLSGFGAVRQAMAQTLLGKAPGAQDGRRDWGVLGLAGTQAGILGVFLLSGHPLDYLLLWLLPLITVSKTLTHFRNVVEHTQLRDVGDPELSRYRTIRCSWLEGFFFAPMNFNYHAEHHFYPGIAYHRLPEAHARMRALPEYSGAVDVQEGYLSFLLREAIR